MWSPSVVPVTLGVPVVDLKSPVGSWSHIIKLETMWSHSLYKVNKKRSK